MKVKFGVKPNLTILKIFVPENGTGTPKPEETKKPPHRKKRFSKNYFLSQSII